nr:late expression factor 11 [Darna trima granulovirus]
MSPSLTKSQVYAVVRETINYKKSHNDTTDVTAHVENNRFASVSRFINERSSKIVIHQPDRPETSVALYTNRLQHLFNLPNSVKEEYEYCVRRNNESYHNNNRK